MQNIYEKLLEEFDNGKDVMFVSITESDGSAPRHEGADMLVDETGLVFGTIGGGTVELMGVKKAMELLAEKKSTIIHYDLTEDSETKMACGGAVTVEYSYCCHTAGDTIGWAKKNAEASKGEKAYIFGCGHIAKALTPILDSIGFRVTVFDNRPEFATEERFPLAEKVICGDYLKLDDYITFEPNDYVVIMTNGHVHDFECEEQTLRKDVAYIGVVGSAKKIASVNARLEAKGISKERCNFLHTPIGTKIKAVTPEEIAVSVAGEMILVRAERREAGK